ncbi:synaptic vesicle glycoprotein 2B-like [Drosophila pseudoobscura]|uniref:Synaptic vesicle glycoprotein 2B-like n=1 Tax=Drosophila pseudoobscura pseudoobscura TaxID=46245 RepID=A0A6I8UQ30_DROPS|nr:synaptic vesicle glycoprotein 2B [Drosophila pseudoobscura]
MQNSLENNSQAVHLWDYDVILEKIGYGKTQWILLIISGLLTITSVAAQQSMSIIVIASQCEFKSTQAEKGLIMASCVAGLFFSTYIWGYISDYVGRRKVLLCGVFASNILQFVLMFVTNIWMFNLINLLVGISIGGVSAALYAYLSEFNTPKHRAVAINYSTMFVSVTAIYVPVTAWMVLSANWSISIGDFVFRPWRLIMLISLLPGLIGGLILLRFPESPKLLLSQNKINEAIQAVAWICQFNRGKPIQDLLNCDDFMLKSEVNSEENSMDNIPSCILSKIARATVPLFHKPHGFYFIISNLAVFGMFFSSNGMQFWFPEIVNRSSEAFNDSSTVCEILSEYDTKAENSTLACSDHISSKTYIDNIIVGVAFLIGFSIQGTLINPLGRKNVLLVALIIATFSGFCLHFFGNRTAVLVLFCLYILLPGLSISIMLGAIVDLVPTHLRGKAVSFCMSLGRLGIIAATNLMGLTLQPYCNITFAICTFVLFVCVILVYIIPIRRSA